MANIVSLPARPTRISTKIRDAINLMVREGRSQTEAAKASGLSRQGLSKAMQRPAVRDLVEATRLQFFTDADKLRVYARALALQTAMDLMKNSKNESIRARMCEFLASDAKVSPVAIHVDARQTSAHGYIYKRPEHLSGATTVEEVEGQPDGGVE